MKFQLGDQFLVNKIECEIVYINNEQAWLAPIQDEENEYKSCAFAIMDNKGKLRDGTRAIAIPNHLSGAV